jgi:hypothetical protein
MRTKGGNVIISLDIGHSVLDIGYSIILYFVFLPTQNENEPKLTDKEAAS